MRVLLNTVKTWKVHKNVHDLTSKFTKKTAMGLEGWNTDTINKVKNSQKMWAQESQHSLMGNLRLLVSAISYHFFIFSLNDSPSKTMKSVFFISSKKLLSFSRYSNFCIFSLPFHTFQIQKDKWKWNNLWCHELACINLQM